MITLIPEDFSSTIFLIRLGQRKIKLSIVTVGKIAVIRDSIFIDDISLYAGNGNSRTSICHSKNFYSKFILDHFILHKH